jgi:hypothetical protein
MTAEQGWIGEPQPPSRTYAPGEEHKWHLMMGAAHACPRCREHQDRLRQRRSEPTSG